MKLSRIGFVLAVAIGASGPARGAEPGTIEYRIRLLDVDGLTWRETMASHFHRVKAEGPATAWTATRSAAEALAKTSVKVVAAPVCLARENEKAEIRWTAAETKDAAKPASSRVQMAGRQLDQGILAHVVVEDGSVRTEPGAEARPVDVARGKVEGEWLVPSEQVLVLSLGIQSVPGEDGASVVRERIAIIEPRTRAPEIKAAVVGPARMPSRSAPLAIHPDGRLAESKVPAPVDPAVSTTSGEVVRPSPQAYPTAQRATTVVDNALSRTGYEADEVEESSSAGESVIRLPIQGRKILEIRTRVLNAPAPPARP